jgi:PhzF family phenazine biosynthesis protein
MRIPFTQVDAFASAAFAGNPAAVMPLSRWPDDSVLQAIAAENNLSETAFLVPDSEGEADYELRWFTPAAEVVMCGHATLASGHVVLSSDTSLSRVRFRTRQAGMLSVERQDAGYVLALPAWRPAPKPLPALVAALGLAPGDVRETLWHHHRYALVVVNDPALVRAVRPDFRALAADGDTLVIVSAPGGDDPAGTDVVSRAFAPGCGIDEDPVTGSAHAVLVPYWADRLGRDTLTAWQASARGGRLGCTLKGDVVELTGACVTVIEGTFLLP